MTSVIGNIFKLTKGNVTHATSIDDWVVVFGYAANTAKGGRMEAEIGVFQIEVEAIAAAASAKALALAPADAGAIAAHAAAMAKVKGSVLQGLSHGSMSAILTARTVTPTHFPRLGGGRLSRNQRGNRLRGGCEDFLSIRCAAGHHSSNTNPKRASN